MNDKICNYTHSLVPADFSGAVFTCAFFQKMLFSLYKLRNVFLVTNDLSGANLVHVFFWHEPRTRCIPKKVIWQLAIWQNWCFG